MFNGIINYIGIISLVRKNYYYVNSNLYESSKIGDSIACAGVCLTVIDIIDSNLVFEISNHTLSITNLQALKVGSRINLEPSLQFGGKVSGHFVLGHVDGYSIISNLTLLEDGCYKLTVQLLNSELIKYIVYKGSIALDGISLTVNEVKNNQFSLNILPYTFNNTTLQFNKINDKLNIEVDVLARYVHSNTPIEATNKIT